MHHDDPRSDAARFTRLWEDYSPRVLRYALRHVPDDVAPEVVSETFLTAWRRRDAVPPDPLPWLLVTARHTILHQHRSHARRRALVADMARVAEVSAARPGPEAEVGERDEMLRALARLGPRDREVLLLVAWDGLSHDDAATVLGVSGTAFRARLSRARGRLSQLLDVGAPDLMTEAAR